MKLRKVKWSDPEITELAGDVQRGFDAIPDTTIKDVSMRFTEVSVLGLERRPRAIEAIRVIDPAQPSVPVVHGTAVNFDWRPNEGGARITRIADMTPGATTYRFTFRITWEQN